MRAISILLLLVVGLVSCSPAPLPKQELANMPAPLPPPPPPKPRPKVQTSASLDKTPLPKHLPGEGEGPSIGDAIVGIAAAGATIWAVDKLLNGGDEGKGCNNCAGDGTVHSGDVGAARVFHTVHRCKTCGGSGWVR